MAGQTQNLVTAENHPSTESHRHTSQLQFARNGRENDAECRENESCWWGARPTQIKERRMRGTNARNLKGQASDEKEEEEGGCVLCVVFGLSVLVF